MDTIRIANLPDGLRQLARYRANEFGKTIYGQCFFWDLTMEGQSFWSAVYEGNYSVFNGCLSHFVSYKPSVISEAKTYVKGCREARKTYAEKLTDEELTKYYKALKIIKNEYF